LGGDLEGDVEKSGVGLLPGVDEGAATAEIGNDGVGPLQRASRRLAPVDIATQADTDAVGAPASLIALQVVRWLDEENRQPTSQAAAAANFAGETARTASGTPVETAYRNRRPSRRANVVRRVEAQQSALTQVLEAALIGAHFHPGIVKAEQKSLTDLDAIGQMRPESVFHCHDHISLQISIYLDLCRSKSSGGDLIWCPGMLIGVLHKIFSIN
jgi:hypothetical protein